MTGVGTFWRTVRHLRWEQVVFRAALPLRGAPVVAGPTPPRRAVVAPFQRPAGRRPSLIGPTTLSVLGEAHTLDEVGWDDPALPLLWRYNQHYFDDLNALDSDARRAWHRALITRWIDDNPVGRGTAWAPYPTSLRIANWIKCFSSSGGAAPEPRWLESLAVQARWLMGRLEWHVLGNHLFVNAKALLMAGRFFEGDEADAWARQGTTILERELPEQVLTDGGQFERSPMYHALALEDVLDLDNTLRAFGPGDAAGLHRRLQVLAPTMHRFLRGLTHPDQTLAHFNDTADDIAPSTAELAAYARRLDAHDQTFDDEQRGLTAFLPSGYVRADVADAVAFLDVAPVAPDYLMAHGHADTLAFELSVRGRRVVVNGGTSRYGVSAERVIERGTSAHSTVVVDDTDSSEVWSGFRVGRRARVHDLEIGADTVAASHDGYSHRPGAPRHHRRWRFSDHRLVVDDTVTPTPHKAVARYHLAPGLRVVAVDARTFEIKDGEARVATVEVVVGRAARGLSRYSPAFGVVVPAESLDVLLVDGRSSTSWTW